MSYCTFVLISKGKAKYFIDHYSVISNILKTNDKSYINKYEELSFYNVNDSDTKFNPAVIIDFDNKILTNTNYNWFDDFKKYLPKKWEYKEFKTDICEGCGYMLCSINNKDCKKLKGGAKWNKYKY